MNKIVNKAWSWVYRRLKPNVERDKDKIILTESNRKHNLQK